MKYFFYFKIHTQPNLTTLHLLFAFVARSWWVIWSPPLKLSPTRPHFGDIHPPLLLPQSPFRWPLPDHPRRHIIRYLITCPITCYTSSPLCNIPVLFLPPLLGSPRTPHHQQADCRARLLSFPIPWSLFRFQTPFGWSIGLSLCKRLWSGLDSCRQLVGRPAATSPTYVFISTLINGERGRGVNLLLWKRLDPKINKYRRAVFRVWYLTLVLWWNSQ